MESQTYSYRNQFLHRAVFNVINRIRQSYKEDLIGSSIYHSTLADAVKLRDTFHQKDNTEIEKKLKKIAEKVGTWSFQELLELFVGAEYESYFGYEQNEQIEFYNSTFFPNLCMPGPDIFDLLGPVASSLKGSIEPATFNVVSKSTGRQEINTGCLLVLCEDQSLCVLGQFVKDTPEYYCKQYTFLDELKKDTLSKTKLPDKFAEKYIKYMTLKDFSSALSEQLVIRIHNAHQDAQKYAKLDNKQIIKKFKKCTAEDKREFLTIILMEKISPNVLSDMVKSCQPEEYNDIFSSLHLEMQEKLHKYKAVGEINSILKKRKREPKNSLEDQIIESGAPEEGINKALRKLQAIQSSRDGDAKAEKFLEGFLKIPFGVYQEERILNNTRKIIKRGENLRKRLKVSTEDGKIVRESQFKKFINKAKKLVKHKRSVTKFSKDSKTHKAEKRRYLSSARKVLDKAVYGHAQAKNQIERILAQWLNGQQRGTIIGLQGPPGNGKTSLIQRGLAKCLKDKTGNEHPFVFIPLGGLSNGSSLLGHSYTYVGSVWGRIVDGLIQSKCMNPIFFFDELDKVSSTERGQEIISVLTHLTDATQNNKFYDEYFQGIPLDLSRAMFVFTFNNANKIDRILRDRIHIINTNALQLTEKVVISQKYLLPPILEEVGFSQNDITFDESEVKQIIEEFTAEAGVRKLKEILYQIVREVNRKVIMENLELPIKLEKEFILDVLKRKYQINHTKIHSKPMVGVMNGLYASSTGLGGITKIEVSKGFSAKGVMDLQLTGNQGDIMKESMSCARTVAWNHLTPDEQKKIKKQEFALHVHCPSGATPKDGPSAGGAITLAMISLLKGITLPNNIAMTGEIDLQGNITEIGGLSEKLLGAKKAGVQQVYIPKDNEKDLNRILEDQLIVLDDEFKVDTVEHIDTLTEKLF